MSNNRQVFVHLQDLREDVRVQVGDGQVLRAMQHGRVRLRLTVNGKDVDHIMEEVLFIPELAYSLLSVAKASRGGSIGCYSPRQVAVSSNREKL